jgi:hypothetical protein
VTKYFLGTLADDLGCFPLDHEPYRSQTVSRDSRNGIRSLVQQSSRKTLKSIQYLYPHHVVARGYTSIYFGENELSLRLIRLSLLPTSHPTGFQPRRVRSSTRFNPRFNLLMGRSCSFASTTIDYVALFRLGFPSASVLRTLTMPITVTRWIIMQKARRHP